MSALEAPPLVWEGDEKVSRTLGLNSDGDLKDLLAFVCKVLETILASPDEVKYRSLRAANKGLATRVLARPGGRELLAHCGFRTVAGADGEAKVAVAARAGEAGFFADAVEWCRALAPARGVELKIAVPRGTYLRAAFGPAEPLSAVAAYVDARARGGGPFELCVARPRRTFAGADLDASLADLGLAPRAALTATAPAPPAGDAPSASEAAMAAARARGVADAAAARADAAARDRKQREARARGKYETERARENALRGFSEDREEKDDQVRRSRRALACRARAAADEEVPAPRRPRLGAAEEPEPDDSSDEAGAAPAAAAFDAADVISPVDDDDGGVPEPPAGSGTATTLPPPAADEDIAE